MTKNLTLALIVIGSIGAGIWFGQQGNQPAPGNEYAHLGGDFTLQSDQGPVSLADFRDKISVLYFGYTSCPDVCITSLTTVASAMRLLDEEQRAQVQPIFISVDPERDSAKGTGEYARYFHPDLIGLTGTPEEIAEVAKRYLVIYAKVPLEDSALGYAVDHSSIVYVIGRNGKINTLVHHGESAEALATAIRAALK